MLFVPLGSIGVLEYAFRRLNPGNAKSVAPKYRIWIEVVFILIELIGSKLVSQSQSSA